MPEKCAEDIFAHICSINIQVGVSAVDTQTSSVDFIVLCCGTSKEGNVFLKESCTEGGGVSDRLIQATCC
jgi:hypothetical protein